MSFSALRRVLMVAATLCAIALGACSGGGSAGLPVPPGSAQAGGPQTFQQAPYSRQQALENAVPYQESGSVELPSLGGFSVSIDVSTPGPTPPPHPRGKGASPLPSGAATPSPTPSASPTASPSPSPSPTPSPSATPAADGHLVHQGAVLGGGPASAATPTISGPHFTLKTMIYPDGAPSPPAPKVQSPVTRQPLVRAFFSSSKDVELASLASVKFTIPASEQVAARGFTVAIFIGTKHEKLLVGDTGATLAKGVVTGNSDGAILLQKGTVYSIILYADTLPPTPPPAGSFSTPNSQMLPPASPGATNASFFGAPQQPLGAPTPMSYQTPFGH